MPGHLAQQHFLRFFVGMGWCLRHSCLFCAAVNCAFAEMAAVFFGGDSITSDFLSFRIFVPFS
jgi:hypothetical protein